MKKNRGSISPDSSIEEQTTLYKTIDECRMSSQCKSTIVEGKPNSSTPQDTTHSLTPFNIMNLCIRSSLTGLVCFPNQKNRTTPGGVIPFLEFLHSFRFFRLFTPPL